eukprot:4229985-Pyramimonas_sp.AAC.1
MSSKAAGGVPTLPAGLPLGCPPRPPPTPLQRSLQLVCCLPRPWPVLGAVRPAHRPRRGQPPPPTVGHRAG